MGRRPRCIERIVVLRFESFRSVAERFPHGANVMSREVILLV
jgi:hypothetical protein